MFDYTFWKVKGEEFHGAGEIIEKDWRMKTNDSLALLSVRPLTRCFSRIMSSEEKRQVYVFRKRERLQEKLDLARKYSAMLDCIRSI